MAPSTYATSWNIQVESCERWDEDAPIVAAAMDEEKEVGLTCDKEGVLKLWHWPLTDVKDPATNPIRELSRTYTPNGKAPLALVRVPRQRAFLAVFPTLISLEEDTVPGDDDSDDGIVDTSQFRGGEVHAYVTDGEGRLQHVPLLQTSHGVLTACCVNASLSEVVIASTKRLCSYTVRASDGDGAARGGSALEESQVFGATQHFRIPQRLMIKFNAKCDVCALAASDDAGVLVGVMRKGGFWCWDAYTGAVLVRGTQLIQAGFLKNVCLHAPSRLLAAMEQAGAGPPPAGQDPLGLQKKKVTVTSKKTLTHVWKLTHRHEVAQRATIDHAGYVPLSLCLTDAPEKKPPPKSKLSRLRDESGAVPHACLVILDSAGTARAWIVGFEVWAGPP